MELNKKLVNFESMNENTKLTLAEALLYTKGLAGGYGGDFPLSTASKDSIYRVPATNKFYVCETAYNGNQISAPNSNFVELSVWKNHDRLNNLENIKIEYRQAEGASNTQSFTFDCKEILAISVLPWQVVVSQPMSMCTHIDGKTLYVKTSHSGCKVFAILRV